MNRRLGITLGALIVATAGVELVVLGWFIATHELAPRTLQIYLFGLGLPAVIMSIVGALMLRAGTSRTRRRQDQQS